MAALVSMEAMLAWAALYGALPTSYDWSRAHATARGGEPLRRLEPGRWPAAETVRAIYGTWAAARADAADQFNERALGGRER